MISFIILITLAYVAAISTLNGNGRIVGGHDIPIEEVPFQISIQYEGEHGCGGSIIAPNYVVTAAHCTDGYENLLKFLSVRVGTSTRNSGGQVVNVTKIYIHPDWDGLDSDISIIELSENLEFNDKIAAIGLPSSSQAWPAGTEVSVTGWGMTSEDADFLPVNLQEVTVQIVDQDNCGTYSHSLCAGVDEGGKDACHSDSGGPLQTNGVLVGIVSSGHGCARPHYPGIYANVSSLRDFIEDVTGL